MSNMRIDAYMACETEYEKADIVMFGAPYDGTTSFRPGTRFGPAQIRRESFGLETYSPYQKLDLTDTAVCDLGDLELCPGDSASALGDITARTAQILSDGKLPFMIGGEHLVTLGAMRAAAEFYPALHIIHFDAHTDLRDDYLGVKLSHACVIRRCHELLGDGRIHQFGIRSGDRPEWVWAEKHTDMHAFSFDGLKKTLLMLKGLPVYLTVDLDVMDPSVFPGTGTPEPGGVSFDDLRRAVTDVCSEADVIACDVNELSPHYDASGASTAAACKIIREMLLALSGERK